MKTIARELVRVARMVAAGDEWVDDKTLEFVKELVAVMKSDRDVDAPRADHNKVRFNHVQHGLFGPFGVPLVLDVMEFGYGDESESLNGTIYSEKQRNFRIPGGFTRTRDPKELWAKAKEMLEDIIARAQARG